MKRLLTVLIVVVVIGSLVLISQNLFSKPQPVQAQVEEQTEDQSNTQSNLNPDKNNLVSTTYTPENYREPLYDPFSNQYREGHGFEENIRALDKTIRTAPTISITVQQTPNTLADLYSGTTATAFTFRANLSGDSTTQVDKLHLRWDFEDNGEWDTYFSKTKTAQHTFSRPGHYTVIAEVLDLNGRLFKASREIVIVRNTFPQAYFTVKPTGGTDSKIFTFNVSGSTDSQYRSASLAYRFDWDGDGQWDTPLQLKTIWQHRFEGAGTYNVVMEAQDPEGLGDSYSQQVVVTQNHPPKANLTVSKLEEKEPPASYSQGAYGITYRLDASSSADPEDGTQLRYRWDLNYTGHNDISFDTGFSSSAFKNMTVMSGEVHAIRVQVQDIDGAVDEMVVGVE